jgi:NAD(P)-dependent dehydrogenase (short-subunit alcohol dehydrogenase family)
MKIMDKVILVTGGATRLGRAMSLYFAKKGAKIFCHYHSSKDEAVSLKNEIELFGGNIALFQYDLMKDDAPQKIYRAALDRFSTIDILINNAALFYKTPFGKIKPQDWDIFHTLNLKSAFFLAQEVSRVMLRQKSGKIINIADSAAETPFPSYLPYSISKAGIITMTKGLAKVLAPHIQVNCIAPGPVLFPQNYDEKEKQFAIEQTLLKREGAPEDIVKALEFLIKNGDYITGTVLPVDGGRHIG